jgi:hypothetical protein
MHAVKMSLLSWLKKSNQNVAPEQEQVDSEERLEQEEQASGIMFHVMKAGCVFWTL